MCTKSLKERLMGPTRPARFTLLLLAVAAACLLGVVGPAAASRPADTVFTHGYVYTVSGAQPLAKAVAVRDGKIVYVGGDREARRLVGPHTKVVNLHGKMMMPGLEDGHTHLQQFVACDMGYEGGTEDAILGKIKAALLRSDQMPYLKSDYVLNASSFVSGGMLPAGTVLTRGMLDRLSKDPSEDPMGTGTTRPIRVSDADFHKFYLNSKAIINAGITRDTPTPTGSYIGHDASGEPNGAFSDYTPPQPIGVPAPQPANVDYLGKLASMQKYNQLGTTSILQALGSPSDLPVWKQLADDGVLTMRVNQDLNAGFVRGQSDPAALQAQIDVLNAARAAYNGYSSPKSPGTLTVDTAKVFADGVAEFPAQTAAMLEPYNINTGTPESPVWVPGALRGADPSVEDATLGFKMLDANHWTIHVHAIGNRAVRVTLDNFAAIQKSNKRWDRRDTITHLQFVDPADWKRFGRLGVVASMQLQWSGRDVYSVDGVAGYINQDVLDTMYPAHSLMNNGAVLAAGSDWPVDPLNPFNQIMVAVTRRNASNPALGKYAGRNNYKEHLTLSQALRMSTMGTAYQLHQDKVTGSIRVGKYADLIVLDRNLFKIPAMQINQTNVLVTMVGGKVVWQDPDNPL
jgi:predicted amidohydrolase YtcJ